MAAGRYVWFDGKFVSSDKANVNVLTHSLQYGSGIFEGIRAYDTGKNSAIFRLGDHVKRFLNSAKICRMKLDFDYGELFSAIKNTVKKNNLKECYIRPFAFYNDSNIGLDVLGKKRSVIVAAVPFGNYFSKKGVGLRCVVSGWRRINPSILPTEAKASGNYVNSILASIDAKAEKADEAILLSEGGFVAEGPAENIFLVEDEKLITPSQEADILLGITRDTIINIAKRSGLVVEEREVHREELYSCDELFFTGTAAELTPIVSVDSRKVGRGRIGPITHMLEGKYSEAVHGRSEEFVDWLTKAY